jgi:hypothetical protein
MAARRKAKTTRRRKAPSIGLIGLTESYVLGSAVTQGLFGTTLYNFATQGWLRANTPGAQMGAGNSWALSAQELLSSAMGDNSHMSSTFQSAGGVSAAIKHNLKANGGRAVATLIFVPMIFRGVKKLARKPITMVNKMLPGGTVKL